MTMEPAAIPESGHVAIFMYHSVSTTSTPAFADFVVSPQRFAEHMAALATSGCTTMTASALAQARAAGEPLPARPVVLTFDDGFLDFAEEALPVLQAHRFTATLYLTTHYVGGTSKWLQPEGEQDRRMLGWSDLESVASEGIEIGAHTDTHPQLDLVGRDALARELVSPKVEIEDKLGVPVRSLAYPFGYTSPRVRDAAQRLGYDNACIVSDLVSTPGDNVYAVPRLTVTGRHEAAEVVALRTAFSSTGDRVRSALRRRTSWALRTVGTKKRESAAYSRSLH